ncbi:MAG: vitamin K epoxide reductase family protein [Patescibacteria group bacterium]
MNIWKIVKTLSIIGIVLALYLFYEFLAAAPVDLCYINSSVNCGAVTKGSLSTFLGMPVSLIGLVGYIILYVSSVLKKKKLLLGMAAFGMVFCLRITYLELFVVKVICPVCLACQTVMLLIFLLALPLNFKKASE